MLRFLSFKRRSQDDSDDSWYSSDADAEYTQRYINAWVPAADTSIDARTAERVNLSRLALESRQRAWDLTKSWRQAELAGRNVLHSNYIALTTELIKLGADLEHMTKVLEQRTATELSPKLQQLLRLKDEEELCAYRLKTELDWLAELKLQLKERSAPFWSSKHDACLTAVSTEIRATDRRLQILQLAMNRAAFEANNYYNDEARYDMLTYEINYVWHIDLRHPDTYCLLKHKVSQPLLELLEKKDFERQARALVCSEQHYMELLKLQHPVGATMTHTTRSVLHCSPAVFCAHESAVLEAEQVYGRM